MLKTLFSFFSGGWQGYAVAFGLAFVLGATGTWRVMSWKEGAAQTEKAAMTVKYVIGAGQINAQIAQVHIPEIVLIHDNTARIQQEIPQHVTPQIDRTYPVPLGFVRMFNDASHGPIPGAAAGSDADPSGVPISDVAHAHAGTEGILDECRSDLKTWWDWYDKQSALWNASQK